MDFTEALNKAKNLSPENISNDLNIFLEGLSDKFVEWNKNRLGNSEDIYGDPLGWYEEITETFWVKEDPPSSGLPKVEGDPYNMDWHSSMFESIYTKIDNSGSTGILLSNEEMDANLPKWRGLLYNIYYSTYDQKEDKLFGFTEEDIEEIRDLIKPFLIEYIRNTLLG